MANGDKQMTDASLALDRAVSRHMRRWWLRVGVWWLVLLVFVYAAAQINYLSFAGAAIRQRLPLLGGPSFDSLLRMLEQLYYVVWLLAAWQVYRQCTDLLKVEHSAGKAASATRCYWLCLLQALPPLGVLTICWLASEACQKWWYPRLVGGDVTFSNSFASWPEALSSLFALWAIPVALMSWLSVLLICRGSDQYCWLWLGTMLACIALRNPAHSLPPLTVPTAFGDVFMFIVLPYVGLVSLLFVAGLLYACASQRWPLAAVMLAGILVLTLLQLFSFNATASAGTAHPTQQIYRATIEPAYQWMPASYQPISTFRNGVRTTEYQLLTPWIRSERLKIAASPGHALLAVGINALWILSQLVLGSWLVRTRFRPRPASG